MLCDVTQGYWFDSVSDRIQKKNKHQQFPVDAYLIGFRVLSCSYKSNHWFHYTVANGRVGCSFIPYGTLSLFTGWLTQPLSRWSILLLRFHFPTHESNRLLWAILISGGTCVVLFSAFPLSGEPFSSSCSWGPFDWGRVVTSPPVLTPFYTLYPRFSSWHKFALSFNNQIRGYPL